MPDAVFVWTVRDVVAAALLVGLAVGYIAFDAYRWIARRLRRGKAKP